MREENPAGVYVAAANYDRRLPFRGFTLYQSPEPMSGYRPIQQIHEEAIVGRAACRIGGRRGWDNDSDLYVSLPPDMATIESSSRDLVLQGRNVFIVGYEMIGIADIEFVGKTKFAHGSYRCRTLLRGMHGTDVFSHFHRQGEPVVWMDGGGFEFVPIVAPIDAAHRYWRALPPGAVISEAETVTTTSILPPPKLRYPRVARAVGRLRKLVMR